MEKARHKVCGYLNRLPGKDFIFVAPLYQCDGKVYRAEIDEASDTIRDFSPLDIEFTEYFPENPAIETREKGDLALYMFVFQGNLFCGDRRAVCVELLDMIRYDDICPLDRYDMFFFMGIPGKIEESLDDAVQELGELGIRKKNFLRPWDIHVNIEQLSLVIRQYAYLLSKQGSFISIDSFQTPTQKDDDLFRFGRFVISKTEVEEKFDALIDMYSSLMYRDLVVYSYLGNKAKSSREFRFRIQPLIGPIGMSQLAEMETLCQNSQSAYRYEGNALELAVQVGEKMETVSDAARKMTAKAKEIDVAQTLDIAEKIKEQAEQIKERYEPAG
jgi:hypothetical protein